VKLATENRPLFCLYASAKGKPALSSSAECFLSARRSPVASKLSQPHGTSFPVEINITGKHSLLCYDTSPDIFLEFDGKMLTLFSLVDLDLGADFAY